MVEPVGFLIVGLFAIGMAISFLAADHGSPTSRALSLFLATLGVTFLANILSSKDAMDSWCDQVPNRRTSSRAVRAALEAPPR